MYTGTVEFKVELSNGLIYRCVAKGEVLPQAGISPAEVAVDTLSVYEGRKGGLSNVQVQAEDIPDLWGTIEEAARAKLMERIGGL